MNRSPLISSHPFPFLLYLEWGLLGTAIVTEVTPAPLFPSAAQFPLVVLVSLILFGAIGLNLPTNRTVAKVLYTVLAFALILCATGAAGRGIRLYPFLYLILVIRGCLIFKMPGRLVVTALAFTCFMVTLLHRLRTFRLPLPMEDRSLMVASLTLNFALLFGLILVFVLLLVNVLLAERESRTQLAQANDQLRKYAAQIENQATLQERNRIAREIHDSLGHFLTGLNIQLESALKLWQTNPDRAKTFLAEAKRLGSTALQEVRQSVAALRSHPLQHQSLEAAIVSLTKESHQLTGILPLCDLHLSQSTPLDVSTAVYRIIQEALTNICKYAHATQVKICLEETAAELKLSIQDDGIGFKLEQNTTGFGLQGMRERTLALGGHLLIVSEPGKGCQIQATFPLPLSSL